MPDSPPPVADAAAVPHATIPSIVGRGVVGGTLMGVANLVPGISGGAMLIMVGIYTRFVNAVAEVVTFKFRWPSLVTIASVAGAAMLTILLLAGTIKDVILDYTWQVYALLIGMRLGVVPLIWSMARLRASGWCSA